MSLCCLAASSSQEHKKLSHFLLAAMAGNFCVILLALLLPRPDSALNDGSTLQPLNSRNIVLFLHLFLLKKIFVFYNLKLEVNKILENI